jgi:hypothetical protein
MLRAMFAGFGSLMSVVDKVRPKPAAEAPAAATAPAPEDTATAEGTATPEDTATPSAVADTAAEPEASAAPEPVVAETATTPETAAATEATAEAEPSAAPESSAGPETGGALPLANYDQLTVASLRARLRNLSNDDLTRLMDHEKANQDRPEVIKMFQNRLIKMTSGFPKLES